ncbi:DNA replication and repair protein RecF [Arthrobacter roseus]|nr:DNA replication and repair protein RecF [Arthrobacter roseus]
MGYLSTLSSHRVSSDAPLIRFGSERALIRAKMIRGGQTSSLELEINGSKANRARINRGNPGRARDVLGICRTVMFAPEDLALVKGDPGIRRRFLDELMVSLVPHHAATRTDYERVLKQRNALLKSSRGGRFTSGHEATLDVWDQHMAQAAARLLHARIDVLKQLEPHFARAYGELTDGSKAARAVYQSSLEITEDEDAKVGIQRGDSPPGRPVGSIEDTTLRYLEAFCTVRKKELERGISLVGPHRDDIQLVLGSAPAKGFASHGESWSVALSLRIGSYYLLCEDDPAPGATPVLMLDDVFAELDRQRRTKLAAIVSTAEQVLLTAAVLEDIPETLEARRVNVVAGGISE